MYKHYSYLEKEFTLKLKFGNRIENINFVEPNLYKLFKFEELVKQESYFEAIRVLSIPIDELNFFSNPFGIVKGIYDLIYGKDTNSNGESSFLPSVIDRLATRYRTLPIKILKNTTLSQLKTYLVGIEYNNNVDNKKEQENYKFKQKAEITDEENKRYEGIMERVNEAKKKLGRT